ncbi:MAG: RpiB/LacA/LacB family sugar-phosphate isomerase [Dehalococcoidia bacterium]
MRVALGSDERSHLTDFVGEDLRRRGMDVDQFGPIDADAPAGATEPWPDVARSVAEQVASGNADCGVLFCWTGTGVSIAANKVTGVRAALCHDAETARAARAWNEANVLCLSLRATPEAVAKEILDAWFSASPDPSEGPNVEKVKLLEKRYGPRERSKAGVKGVNSGG